MSRIGKRPVVVPKGVTVDLQRNVLTVEFRAPEGVKIVVENPTTVRVEGANKEIVGQVASEMRQVRPPEPYKGKGIRYQGEQVRRKAGKTGAK